MHPFEPAQLRLCFFHAGLCLQDFCLCRGQGGLVLLSLSLQPGRIQPGQHLANFDFRVVIDLNRLDRARDLDAHVHLL
ncbi:hypothetical protein SDC9_156269 [bioreactor metagenome]|uniref:Uncharacterized protein n=1 Tax=bioreactor metagenome TaxID=1076179 RepID=A0A645F3Y8_9ZZZZ